MSNNSTTTLADVQTTTTTMFIPRSTTSTRTTTTLTTTSTSRSKNTVPVTTTESLTREITFTPSTPNPNFTNGPPSPISPILYVIAAVVVVVITGFGLFVYFIRRENAGIIKVLTPMPKLGPREPVSEPPLVPPKDNVLCGIDPASPLPRLDSTAIPSMMGSTAVPGSSSADMQSLEADHPVQYPENAFSYNNYQKGLDYNNFHNEAYQPEMGYLQSEEVYLGDFQPHGDYSHPNVEYQQPGEEYEQPGVIYQYPEGDYQPQFYYDPEKMYPVYDDYGIFVGYQMLNPNLTSEELGSQG